MSSKEESKRQSLSRLPSTLTTDETTEYIEKRTVAVSNKIYRALDPFSTQHEIRGRWNCCFVTTMLIMSILCFSLLLWAFLEKVCDIGTISMDPYTPSYVLEDVVDRDGMQVCGTYGIYNNQVQNSVLYPPSGYNYGGYINDYYAAVGCCRLPFLDLEDYQSVKCNTLPQFDNCFGENSILFEKLPYCGDFSYRPAMVSVAYVQCTPPATAVVNAIQYTFYLQIIIVWCYWLIRVYKKYGFNGLRNWDAWRAILNNAKEKTEEEIAYLYDSENPSEYKALKAIDSLYDSYDQEALTLSLSPKDNTYGADCDPTETLEKLHIQAKYHAEMDSQLRTQLDALKLAELQVQEQLK